MRKLYLFILEKEKESSGPMQDGKIFNTAQKMKFSIKEFFSKCEEITEEILNGKLHFLCSATCSLVHLLL